MKTCSISLESEQGQGREYLLREVYCSRSIYLSVYLTIKPCLFVLKTDHV